MTKSSLSSELKTQQAMLDSKYGSVQEVSTKVATHPNSSSHEQMDRIVTSIAEDVKKAWELQYNRQVKIMQWPNELGAEFTSAVDKYRPIENLPFPVTNDPLGLPLRERYRDYVDPLFPRLAEIIGSSWRASVSDLASAPAGEGAAGGIGAPTGGGGRGMMGPGMMGPGMAGSGGAADLEAAKQLVVWDVASQKDLMQSVLWWHNTNKAPSTLEILYTQEDLWILEGLMNIIKATNGDAQENFQAAIKNIEFIRIGKKAVGRAGEISSLASTGNMGGMGMGMGGSGSMMPPGEGGDMGDSGSGGSSGGSGPTPGMDGMDGMGMEGMLDAASGGSDTSSGPDPASGRYVDTAFQPITGEKIRSVVTSGALDPTDAPLAVAKRIPVRMRFMMDQRKLNRLLTECGNADLMLEIKQVRINTTPAEAAGSGGLGGMMGGSGGSGGGRAGPGGMLGAAGGMGLGAPEGSGGGLGPTGGSPVVGASKTFDLPVEIYGVVYLFNPVDMNKLGLQNVTADTQLENVGRVTAEESTGVQTDQPSAPAAAGEAGSAPANNGGAAPATPAPATPAPAAPTAPQDNAAGGVPAAGAPAAGQPAAPAAGAPNEAGAAAAPSLPAANGN